MEAAGKQHESLHRNQKNPKMEARRATTGRRCPISSILVYLFLTPSVILDFISLKPIKHTVTPHKPVWIHRWNL